MPAEFKTSRQVEPCRLLGLTLSDLTIGHLLLLHDVNSPLVTGGQELTLDDLLLAVFICADTHAKSAANLQSSWRMVFFFAWSKINRKANWLAVQRKFLTWFNESIRLPKFKANDGGKPVVSPWYLRLAVCLMTEFGMSWEQAQAFPVRDAQNLYATIGELKYGLELQSERDDSFAAFIREMNLIPKEQRAEYLRKRNESNQPIS